MIVEILPSILKGKIFVPPSKSVSHRALICASLADGTSTIKNLLDCEDTDATINVLTALGAEFQKNGRDISIKGINIPRKSIIADCNDSGSTLRFLIPVTAALGAESIFTGKGKLPTRPITPYFTELQKNGIIFTSNNMPYEMHGKLKAGKYSLQGNISSQFISGLLFALPLLDGDSCIEITSPLQSKPYVDITIDCLEHFGINVKTSANCYYVKGPQKYKACDFTVEGDLSQAAFFLVANCLGADIITENINDNSIQGDAEIINITRCFNRKAFNINAEQIPDLVPILTVLACFTDGISYITGCERLRIKESDRLEAISCELNKLGAKITAESDFLEIHGVESLNGGECDSHNDHRIAMACSIAALKAKGVVRIKGAECVSKSYPGFFNDYRKLGGEINVIND